MFYPLLLTLIMACGDNSQELASNWTEAQNNGVQFWASADYEEALGAIAEARSIAVEMNSDELVLSSDIALVRIYVSQRRFDEAEGLGSSALETLKKEGASLDLVDLQMTLASLYGGKEERAKQEALLRGAVAAVAQMGDAWFMAGAANFALAEFLYLQGDFKEAVNYAAAACDSLAKDLESSNDVGALYQYRLAETSLAAGALPQARAA